MRCFNNGGHQNLCPVETKINYMVVPVGKQGYLLGLFLLNNTTLAKLQKEKMENEQVIVILN